MPYGGRGAAGGSPAGRAQLAEAPGGPRRRRRARRARRARREWRRLEGGGGGGGRDDGGGGRGWGDRHGAPRSDPVTEGAFSDLQKTLRCIDGKKYGAYKQLYGSYAFESQHARFQLIFDHIQTDPFAAPTRAHITIAAEDAGFPADLVSSPIRRVASADYLTRMFFHECRAAGGDTGAPAGGRGGYNGEKGGAITIDCPGQHVVQRSSVVLNLASTGQANVEARFTLAMPARGRTILGSRASLILTEMLPHIVTKSLFATTADLNSMRAHVFSVEDQAFLREQLAPAGLVAFVRDGAILPRASGSSDLPLPEAQATAFVSPETLRRKFVLPNAGEITGMAIPVGVSLIVGGGFHGKSTLLQALETGVYNRVPGDGREFVSH